MRYLGIIGLIIVLCMPAGGWAAAQAANPPEQQQSAVGQTPPRLSFVDGQASFWRPGAQDWTQAQVNTPLEPGDQLYTGSPGNLELQIAARAFVRTWANTQLGLENQEPDFLQFKVTTGYAAFDLRMLEPGRTVELDTPNAAFTIDHEGYYRVDVDGERTSFITRRGGQATVTPAGGPSMVVAPSEEVVIEGAAGPQLTSYTAPQLDEWDQWNYARTDHLLESVSARYVSPEIYGADDLDSYGDWRIVPAYGPVWVPTTVPPGWVPYSTGAWIMDPYYGWTWVDTQPWGWAPCHYGRWVFVDGFWAWAPGPVVVRPAYAPALVAFFGGPGVGITVAGGPVVGWVALGWGEPCVPWWGPAGFIHRPWWGGWGGPRVVNNVVITRTTVVAVQHIRVYRNAGVPHALVAVSENRFGRGTITSARIEHVEARDFRPLHESPRINATPASFGPDSNRGIQPPKGNLQRPVVATRPPHTATERTAGATPNMGRAAAAGPAPRIVSVPPKRGPGMNMPRLPYGHSAIERSMGDRGRPPAPPNIERHRRPATGPPVMQEASPQNRRQPQASRPSIPGPQPQTRQYERQLAPQGQGLPGEPANRISPQGRGRSSRVYR